MTARASGQNRRARHPTSEERALWHSVNRDTVPLSRALKLAPEAIASPAPVRPFSHTVPQRPARPVSPHPSPVPARFIPAAPVLDELADRTPGLDRKTARSLRRGERTPEMRLDLHGMSADRAHAALNAFIFQARASGARCVLVITGKGGAYNARAASGFGGDGILRREVPHWLRLPPLRDAVVGVYRAHARHGGDGALYVYLRKSRA